ncbi:hypothetical protein [Kitasatospora mediocidica]|nr:hypothetical protein [Kitasatospora mediocidica]
MNEDVLGGELFELADLLSVPPLPELSRSGLFIYSGVRLRAAGAQPGGT